MRIDAKPIDVIKSNMIKFLFGLILLGMVVISPVWGQSSADGQTEFTAAVVKEQDVTFAVVIVKRAVLDDKKFADALIDHLGPGFGGIQVILMAQDAQGTPTYYGRTDIAKFLSSVPLESIPWKQYILKQSSESSVQ